MTAVKHDDLEIEWLNISGIIKYPSKKLILPWVLYFEKFAEIKSGKLTAFCKHYLADVFRIWAQHLLRHWLFGLLNMLNSAVCLQD